MERLDAESTKRFIDAHADILDAQDNVFASSAFLKMFIEQIPAKRYFAQRLGDAVVLLEEKGTLSSCYVEQAMTVVTVTTAPREAVMRFFRDLQSPVLRLQPLADTSDFLRLPGWYAREFDCHENWYMPTQGMTYENYVAARPWKERDKKVRTWKGTVAIEPTETGIPAFLEVYAKSWKRPEPHPNFVPAFMRMCAREGWLRVSVARMDGKADCGPVLHRPGRHRLLLQDCVRRAIQETVSGTHCDCGHGETCAGRGSGVGDRLRDWRGCVQEAVGDPRAAAKRRRDVSAHASGRAGESADRDGGSGAEADYGAEAKPGTA
jgi:hypothetical protein